MNDRLFEGSKSMKEGAYFEYYFTLLLTGKGSLPKDGKIPKREMYKDGSKPLAEYARAEANAKRLVEYFNGMGIKVVSAGVRQTDGKYEGTIDLICEATKEIKFADGSTWNIGFRFVIDLKYSGLLDDKWNKMGWGGMLQPGYHIQKEHHKIQATHYHMITKLPFYYLVVSSKNETDLLFLYIPVSEQMIKDHIEVANNNYDYFEFISGVGFEPRPSISRCNDCPLRAECTDKHTFPHPITIEI